MKKLIYRIIALIVISFICIFLVVKIISRISNKYETFILNSSKIEVKCNASGVIFKNEVVVDLGNENIVKNIFKDGTKVGINSKIAQIYKTKEDVLKYEKICELEEDLENLKKINKESLNKNINIDNINKNIYLSYEKLLEFIDKKDMSNITEEKKKLTNYLNKKEILIDNKIKIKDTISKLEKEISNIEKTINMPLDVLSEHSGYFVGSVDGFEEKCSLSSVENLNFEEYKEFIKKIDSTKKLNNKNIKIITSPKILYKAILPAKDIAEKKLGDICKIKLNETGEKIPANITDIMVKSGYKEAIVTFEILNMTEKLASVRKSNSEIIIKKIDGFKIPKEALRINKKNEIGVYVFEIDKIKFKKVDILLEDENFIVCRNKPKENINSLEYIKNYDRVILKGRNLYDGKKV